METNVRALLALCEKFIEDQRITSAEVVGDADRVMENAYEFIFNICEILGYAEVDDD